MPMTPTTLKHIPICLSKYHTFVFRFQMNWWQRHLNKIAIIFGWLFVVRMTISNKLSCKTCINHLLFKQYFDSTRLNHYAETSKFNMVYTCMSKKCLSYCSISSPLIEIPFHKWFHKWFFFLHFDQYRETGWCDGSIWNTNHCKLYVVPFQNCLFLIRSGS